jgi:hypothetical protein
MAIPGEFQTMKLFRDTLFYGNEIYHPLGTRMNNG